MIDSLYAKEDRTKFDYYLKMNVFEFLNHLCYLRDKADSKSKPL